MSISADVIRTFEANPLLVASFPPGPTAQYLAQIFPGLAPAGTAFPYVQVKDNGEHEPDYFGSVGTPGNLTGRTMFAYPTFELQVFAEGLDAANTLGKIVRNIFDTLPLPLEDGIWLAPYREMYRLQLEKPRSGNQLDLWSAFMKYRLMAQKATV